jgi:hypothetical protein
VRHEQEGPQKQNPFLTPKHENVEMDSVEEEEAAKLKYAAAKLKHAAERLKTFHAWPKFLLPKRSQLANAGFVYTNQGDRVRCFACKVLLCDWKRSDDPFAEHYKWSNDCEFLKVCYVPEKQAVSLNQSKPVFHYGG